MTDDENKLRQAYNTALYNMQKANPKSVAPGGAETQLQFFSSVSRRNGEGAFSPDLPRRIRKR